MKATIYFKTKEAIDKAAKERDEFAKSTSVNCACGESYGYYFDDVKMILCEACYEDAPRMEMGE